MGMSAEFDFSKLEDDLAQRGWVARDLARAANVSDMTISRALKGLVKNPRTWSAIAKALGVSVRRYHKRKVA